MSPFSPATDCQKRIKLFLWGDSGVGKTTLALQFPAPTVLDLEGGASLYGGSFSFDILSASTANEVMDAIDWLLANEHPYQTLVIDPMTVYWDALQRKWSEIFLSRNKTSKGFRHEFYDFQPRDWMTIKAEFKEFIRKLLALDMNVVVTARQKSQYADGGFMQKIGETFDGEKSLPYHFDTIVRLWREENHLVGECLKDRSNTLPMGKKIDISIATFAPIIGDQRPAKPLEMATSEQVAEIVAAAERLGLSGAKLDERLTHYGATGLDDLTRVSAAIIIKKINNAIDKLKGVKND